MPATCIADFDLVKLIGSGHFGFVYLAKEQATGAVYALKQVDKLKYLRNNNVEHLFVERDIMARTTSQWLVKLQYSFYDANSAYFVMDFLPGGDVMQLLVRSNDCFDEKTARFYLAETCQAINALHLLHYVHRDVKPENLFLDSAGHVCLGDFGSAAKLSPGGKVSAKMVVGTPEYVSPEVLLSIEHNAPEESYGVECDWWSFGVLAFEMVYGCTPFEDDSQMALFNKIMNYDKYFRFPENETVDGKTVSVSPEMKQLIRHLLAAPNKRFGYSQIRNHAFFAGLNFDRLRSMKPPFTPQLAGPDDTKYFPAQQQQKQTSPSKTNANQSAMTTTDQLTTISPDKLPGMRGFNFVRSESAQYKVQTPVVTPAVKKERSHEVHFKSIETETEDVDLSEFNRDCSNMLRRLVENDRMIAALREEISQRVSLFEQVQLQRDMLERDLTKQMAENALLTKQVSLQRRELENLERAVRHQLTDVRRQLQVRSAASSVCNMPATPAHTQTDDSGVIDIDSLLEQLSTLREQVESLSEEKSSLAEQLRRAESQAKDKAQQVSLQRQSSIRDMEGQTSRLRAAEAESRELRRKMDDLRSEHASHDRKTNSEISSAKSEIARLEIELADARERAQTITGLRTRLADAETKVVLLEQRLQRAYAKLEERERQLREKEQAAAARPSTPATERKTQTTIVSTRSTAVGTSPSIDNDRTHYKQRLDELEKESSTKISDLQKQVTTVERSRDEAKAMVTRLRKALTEAEADLEKARHQSDKLRSEHGTAERELKRDLESLRLELALVKESASEAQKTATEERKSRDNLAKEVAVLEKKLRDAEMKNVGLEKEIAGIANEISRIEVLAAKERKMLSNERDRRVTAERELTELRRSATNAQQHEASWKTALTDNLEAARHRNDELNAELSKLNSAKVTAEHDLKIVKARAVELEDQLHELRISLSEATDRLSTSESLREDLACRLDRLVEEREALQRHISQTESQYGIEKYRMETTINQQIKLIDFMQSKTKPPQTPSKGVENKPPKSALKSSSKRHEAVPLSCVTVKFSDSMVDLPHRSTTNETIITTHEYRSVTPPTMSATNSLLALGPTRQNNSIV